VEPRPQKHLGEFLVAKKPSDSSNFHHFSAEKDYQLLLGQNITGAKWYFCPDWG